MKKISLMIGVLVLILGLSVSAYAIERHIATLSSLDALEVIDAGVDWDGKTPLSLEEQTDRMNANVEVLQTEKRQRNQSGLLGSLLVSCGSVTALVGLLKKRR